MTYTINYEAKAAELTVKQQALLAANDNEPTAENYQIANEFWELAYNRCAELAKANGIKLPACGEMTMAEFLFDAYDYGERWPDDDELLDEFNDWFVED